MLVKRESCSSLMMIFRYVISGDRFCISATCTIDGQEIQECTSIEETGYVSFDCSTDGSHFSPANGLPDHDVENYSVAGILPPLLGSAVTNTRYELTTEPIYNADSDVFESGGGTLAVAVNSVSIFNQFTGIGTVAVTDETVDDCGWTSCKWNLSLSCLSHLW